MKESDIILKFMRTLYQMDQNSLGDQFRLSEIAEKSGLKQYIYILKMTILPQLQSKELITMMEFGSDIPIVITLEGRQEVKSYSPLRLSYLNVLEEIKRR